MVSLNMSCNIKGLTFKNIVQLIVKVLVYILFVNLWDTPSCKI